MAELDLKHGPWTAIFSGEWKGHEVSLYQNPDMLTMLMLVDTSPEGQAKGVLIVLNKYFTFKGSPEELATALRGYSLVFEKNTPTFRAKYFALSSSPRYAKPDQESIQETIEENFAELRQRSEQAIESSTAYQVDLTDIRNSGKDLQDKLFSEPSILTGLMVTAPGVGAVTETEGGEAIADAAARAKATNEATALLGKKLTGENATEVLQSFLTTIISGSDKEVKKAAHVVLENCVLNNVITIVYDEDNYFERMKTPNQNFDREHYPELEPIGMPVKNVTLEKIGINLDLMDSKSFREILRIAGDSITGNDTYALIGEVFYKYPQGIDKLDDVIGLLLQEEDPQKMFHSRRAARFLKILEQKHPGVFRKGTDMTQFVSAYAAALSQAIRLPLQNVTPEIKKAVMLSMSSAFLNYYKERNPSSALKALHLMTNANNVMQADSEKVLDAKLIEVYKQSQQIGIGYLFGLDVDAAPHADVQSNQSLSISFVTETEVAVKEKTGKPYRAVLRPPLSAY